jgi:precorrin-6A/cobalt-precorrin-6A reductase
VLPRDIKLIFDRGPFDEPAETALLTQEKIDVLVSKNSGGAATYAKIAATRKLGIPVVMIARPTNGTAMPWIMPRAPSIWLEQRLAHRAIPVSARGV